MLTVQNIPLSKLTASPANVRHGKKQEGIKQLAASIKAHGLLQNLTVRKGTGDLKGRYEVVAGERRLSALQRLAKEKHIAASAAIPCHVIDGNDTPEEISLAENVTQSPMHPADQYEAFAKLHREQNMPAEDIAARFGVSAAIVRQRLKLGSVSPKLVQKYRNGEMTLEQLTAFTITDDHTAQERVWRELPRFNDSREAILDALTEANVPASDRRALFVGVEAYRKAGGTVIRDLFDNENDGYLTDTELLNRLVREKLQRFGAKVMAEGWKWVAVDLNFDHGAAAQMRRVSATLRREDQEKVEALQARYDEIYDSPEDIVIKGDDLDAIEADITAIQQREQYRPDDIARAGAFVCLGADGEPRIERGYLRKEDETAAPENGESPSGADEATAQPDKPKGLSDKLMTELTAYRTSALRNELGLNPEAALTSVLHALVMRLFYRTERATCLLLSGREAAFATHAPAAMEGEAEKAIAARHAAWAKRFPDEVEHLWDWIAALDKCEQLALLAHCAGLMVDAAHDARIGSYFPADALAKALGLDMTKYWQPTAANYFSRVSKDRIAEAVSEAVSPEAADNLADMKKGAMAEAAEQRLKGKGWLPPVLRTA